MASRTDLGILLALGYQTFVRELHDDLVTRGYDDLARSDGFVFRALAVQPLSISRLAERLDISKQGAGQIVDDMTRRGYLSSRPDPDDRRSRLIELSDRGVDALAAARSFHRRYEQRLTRRHGRATVDTLRELLGAMSDVDPADAPDPRLRAMLF